MGNVLFRFLFCGRGGCLLLGGEGIFMSGTNFWNLYFWAVGGDVSLDGNVSYECQVYFFKKGTYFSKEYIYLEKASIIIVWTVGGKNIFRGERMFERERIL